jgi:hypothetical protein
MKCRRRTAMGTLRNQLEVREKPWCGFSGIQIACLLWVWHAIEGDPTQPIYGEPHWHQTRRALVRKGIIQTDSHPRYLTAKGVEWCSRMVTAFPAVAAEAKAETDLWRRNRGA